MAQASARSHLSPSVDRLLMAGKIRFSNPRQYMPMFIHDLQFHVYGTDFSLFYFFLQGRI